jgi:hypothetical protein
VDIAEIRQGPATGYDKRHIHKRNETDSIVNVENTAAGDTLVDRREDNVHKKQPRLPVTQHSTLV